MKLKLSIDHQDPSIADVATSRFIQELNTYEEIKISSEEADSTEKTRGDIISLIIEILGGAGGALTAIEIAKMVYNYVKNRRISLSIENEKGEKISVSYENVSEETRKEVEEFIKQAIKNESPADSVSQEKDA